MTCIHHYSILQSSFDALKILSTPPIFPSPTSNPNNHYSFTVSIVLSFPECHIIRIIQNVDFSDWLFSLSDLHLVSSMSFQGLVAHFFLIPERYSII